MTDKHDKKGFSGLSSLTSDITNIEEPINSESKTETKLSSDNQATAPKSKATPAKVQSISHSSSEKMSKEKSDGSSGGKWILGIISILFVIWLVNHESNKKPSYNSPPQSDGQNRFVSEMPTSSRVKNPDMQFTKPTSIGTDNVLSIPEIRWCIRESIRIETMKDIIDINDNIDEFNRNVDDYNSYCGSYRYRQGSQQSAERDVESYRSQIVAEAVQQAKQLGQPSLSSYPLASSNDSISNTPSVAIPPPIQPPSPFQDSLPQDKSLGESNDRLVGVTETPLKLTPIEDTNAKFKVMVNAEQANVRLSPEKQNNILGVVTQGQQLNVISESGDYFLVKTSEGDGFIHNSVVQGLDGSSFSSSKVNDDSQSNLIITNQNKGSPEITPPVVNSVNSTKEKFKVIVTSLEANVRKTPQKADNILGIVKQGERLSVVDITDDYYLVSTSSGDVFIHNSTVQSEPKETNTKTSDEKMTIDNIAYKNKPETHNSIVQSESKENNKMNNNTNLSDINMTMDNLPYEDQSAIESACIGVKSQGAAVYRECVKNQLDQLKGSIPMNIDNLPYEDQSAIESACIGVKSQGAAVYRKCVKNQLDQLKGSTPINIDNLPYDDRSAIESVCIMVKSQGAAAYRKCVKQQVDQLQGTVAVDISHFPYNDQSAISSACVLTRSQGAAAYRRCVKQQVDQLNKN